MAEDLYESVGRARELFDLAGTVLGFDLARVAFQGPEEELKQTRVTQPAIFVHSVILNELLQERGLRPAMAAGHSLGEYSALVSAGAMDFADALQVVKVRAEAMQEAGEKNPGTMAAVIGLEATVVEEVCREVSESVGVVEPANFNSPGQVAISGTVEGVRAAGEILSERGAKRVVELTVSGAFHSPLMHMAREAVAEALSSIEIRPTRIPVYANVTGKPMTRPEEIRRLLEEQITSPVRWVEIVENMIADGAERFYEVGPGTVLKGLLRRIDRSKRCTSIDKWGDLQAVEGN
jgi:[acyl-carrier-protein] S-malonyltransferase